MVLALTKIFKVMCSSIVLKSPSNLAFPLQGSVYRILRVCYCLEDPVHLTSGFLVCLLNFLVKLEMERMGREERKEKT